MDGDDRKGHQEGDDVSGDNQADLDEASHDIAIMQQVMCTGRLPCILVQPASRKAGPILVVRVLEGGRYFPSAFPFHSSQARPGSPGVRPIAAPSSAEM